MHLLSYIGLERVVRKGMAKDGLKRFVALPKLTKGHAALVIYLKIGGGIFPGREDVKFFWLSLDQKCIMMGFMEMPYHNHIISFFRKFFNVMSACIRWKIRFMSPIGFAKFSL